jgi:hypothetical protein
VDIDGDSWDDLIVSGEWMSLRFFKNNKGKSFKEVTDEVYRPEHRGWWYDIEKGDFDNDGDMDIIVGNLGLNYKYEASVEKPFRIYLNDFDKNATYDIVLNILLEVVNAHPNRCQQLKKSLRITIVLLVLLLNKYTQHKC